MDDFEPDWDEHGEELPDGAPRIRDFIGSSNPDDFAGALCADLPDHLKDRYFYPARGSRSEGTVEAVEALCDACPAGRATGNGRCWELAATASGGYGFWDGDRTDEFGPNVPSLTGSDIRGIRRDVADGKPFAEIGEAYGRSAHTIHDINVGRTWADVA